jgi:hypothetical protein
LQEEEAVVVGRMLQEVTEEVSLVTTVQTVQILGAHKLQAGLLQIAEAHVE